MSDPKKPAHDRLYRRHAQRPVVVYRQPQVVEELPLTIDDQAKLTLLRLIRDARSTIMGRVNAQQGSMAGNELWIRYRQAESSALVIGNSGRWSQALEQFRQDYTALLAAVPSRDAEPIGRGARGVGFCCGVSGCTDNCPGCANCRGKRNLVACAGLLERVRQAVKAGDEREARAMIARARDTFSKLEPKDQELARPALAAVANEVVAMGGTNGTAFLRITPSRAVSDVSSTAALDIKSQQDSILRDGQAVKASFADTLFFGAPYQEKISPLLDRLSFVMRLLSQSRQRGQVSDAEYEELRQRDAQLQSWLNRQSNGAWQEQKAARSIVTALGGVTSALGFTDPQSGSDVKASDRVKQAARDAYNAAKDALGALPTAGKVLLAGAAGYAGYRAFKAVR